MRTKQDEIKRKHKMTRNKLTYKHTKYASYIGYVTQAIVNNLAPLLFIVFREYFDLTYEQL